MPTKAAPQPPATPIISIGPTIDKMHALRERKRTLDEQIKEIEKQYAELETALMDKLAAEGTTAGTGKLATASISEIVVGNITDWDELWAFAKKKGYSHLFQRRLSDPAVRELFERGIKVPGVEPFTRKRLNLRQRA